MLALVGCEREGEEVSRAREQEAVRMPEVHMHWPRLQEPKPLTRADAKPLEFLRFDEIVGEGYEQVELEVGEPLYTGNWLGLGWGKGESFGGHHVIVNVFGSRPRDRYHRDIRENVLLDMDSGEVGPSFARELAVDWKRGRALVERDGDERVYLLDAEVGELVSIYPEGTHPYVYGRNYWVELGERVWIAAKDAEGGVHVFVWEELGEAPVVPERVFPFWPQEWRHTVDHVEVYTREKGACRLAILTEAGGYRCLDEDEEEGRDLYESEPLVDGWRFIESHDEDLVFNVETGESYRLDALCEVKGSAYLRYADSRNTELRIVCSDSDELWALWSVDERLRLADRATTRDIHGRKLSPTFNEWVGQWSFYGETPDGVVAVYNKQTQKRELVGDDFFCSSDDWYGRSGGPVYGEGCTRGATMSFAHREARTRSRRLKGEDFCVAADESVVAVQTVGAERVVRLLHFDLE